MGIAPAMITAWENGSRQPDSLQTAFLAKILKFTVDFTDHSAICHPM
jgi:hypothetical protein